jgi:ferritin-like metal-binding protein YciE
MAVSTSFADIGASGKEALQTLFITGVKNAHALEKEARQILSRQIERVTNYPEVAQKLRMHLDETNRQEERIDEILHALGEDRSLLKDWATQIMGNMAAVAHVPMADEILKDTFANHAFENFEIAAYTSLIAMADAAGHSNHIPALEQTLREERKMAQAVHDLIEPITRRYLMLEEQGRKADR